MTLFKSSVRVMVDQINKKTEITNTLNGEFIKPTFPDFKLSERPPDLSKLMKKMKNIFELIKSNQQLQDALSKGLYNSGGKSDSSLKDGSDKKSSGRSSGKKSGKSSGSKSRKSKGEKVEVSQDKLPLTLPLIRFCLADDMNDNGLLTETAFVNLVTESFPSVTVPEAYILAGLGKHKTGKVDYMSAIKVIERRILELGDEDDGYEIGEFTTSGYDSRG